MIAMIESDLDTSSVQNERQEEKKARWAWSDYITWEIRSASAVAKEACSHMTFIRLNRAFSLASWQYDLTEQQYCFSNNNNSLMLKLFHMRLCNSND